MFKKLTSIFQKFDLADNATEVENQISPEMAATVLLCEVMRADGVMSDQEQSLLTKLVSQEFCTDKLLVTEFISEACHLSEHAIDFHQFTSVINKHFKAKEKTHIVALLWKLANSDGNIANIEEHIIRRIADLLHLSQAEYIRAKEHIKTNK